MKKGLFILGAILGAVSLVWAFVGWDKGAESTYRFVSVERGDVESVVTSTGTMQAITTVEVGTQVSGQIAEIFVDFNDRVTKNQLIARIDPVLLQQEVRAAEANVERNQAELDQTERELDRIERLYQGQVVTESEYTTAQYQNAVAEASQKSALVTLERARRNLGYTEIRSPIDGVILSRNVDVGQTVAASLSAPVLFMIAEDLSAMEILASVDESDIGQIREGQPVRFTVQAYTDESFSGTVGQVRLQSTSQENVVNYTVAIAVENRDGRLLPGMTATVDFIVNQAEDVLKVANSALRFRPTSEMTEALRESREKREDAQGRGELMERARPDSTPAAGQESERAKLAGSTDSSSGNRSLLWYLDEDGQLGVTPVRTGITDGQSTAIASPGIEEGMQIIAAVTTGSSSTTVNPFQSQQNQGARGGPPPGM